MKAKLIIVTGSRAGTTIDLEHEDVTIGRKPDRTIAFSPNEVIVSGEHAKITYRDGKYFLRDEGSKNGTFVNGERVVERQLTGGELIEFGPRGPSAQFVLGTGAEILKTVEVGPHRTSPTLLALAKMRVAARSSGRTHHTTTVIREFVRLGYLRAAKPVRWLVIGVAAVSVALIAVVIVWAQRNRADLERSLAQVAVALQEERTSREELRQELIDVQARSDSLQSTVERGRQAITRSRRFSQDAIRRFSRGVPLIVYTYGFVNRATKEFLRARVDRDGNPILEIDSMGRQFPAVRFGGRGPRLQKQGSATGILVDSAGWILTNRHVSEPWVHDSDFQVMRQSGLDVEGHFIVLRAYFPPGGQSYPLVVDRMAEREDVALMRSTIRGVAAPVLPLAHPDSTVRPGEELVFIGYPTGVYNLVFRVPARERQDVVNRLGQDAVRLAAELARRGLIQPLVTNGSVSDVTSTEVIHTAETTGGGSGGPLMNSRLRVIAIHYAAVESPITGDPFRTQRGVPVRFVWSLLPSGVGGKGRGS